jgi:hypothetical protein
MAVQHGHYADVHPPWPPPLPLYGSDSYNALLGSLLCSLMSASRHCMLRCAMNKSERRRTHAGWWHTHSHWHAHVQAAVRRSSQRGPSGRGHHFRRTRLQARAVGYRRRASANCCTRNDASARAHHRCAQLHRRATVTSSGSRRYCRPYQRHQRPHHRFDRPFNWARDSHESFGPQGFAGYEIYSVG